MKLKHLLLSFLLVFSWGAFAQSGLDYYLPKNVTYNQKIPTPKQFLGYDVGEMHASPYEINAYWKEVARLSDRFKIEPYGKTFENRELLFVTISSPANLSKIDQLKADHKKLTDPSKSGSLKIKDMPVVVWLGYSVHGNEASGTNSSLLTAYYLAAAEGKQIDSLLNESVIVIDPCINPDGGTRFSSWVNQNKSSALVSDANSREFKETWPGGRTNHYWFDLNRDWLYQQLPESRGRLVKFYEWQPNILTDHHEMGSNSSFFFQPGVPSRTHPMTPQSNINLTEKIGKYHAAYLDKIGSQYFTQESYDDFYYGKGSTLPDVNGSIGILFEQASSRGHLQETVNGPLSFPFTIRNQFTCTLSTLRAGKDMREELLTHLRDFYAEKPKDDVKAYVFGGGNDQVRVWETVNILRRNQIEVYKLGKNEKVNNQDFEKESSYVVPLSQPKHRLITSMFEKRTTFKDSAFYDVSAWTVPLCMNIPFSESKVSLSLGDKVQENLFPEGAVVGKSTYGYLFEWDGYYVSRAAYELLSKGFVLKYATEPFSAVVNGQEKKFGYGTVQIICKGNDPTALLETLAKRDGITFYAQTTGLTPSGIDFGSEKFRVMDVPVALMITGDGVDYNDAGEVWHLLDQRVNYPLAFADISQVNRMNLSKYTHIILNNGRYGDLSDDVIRNYVQRGGVLIALGEGAVWASQKKISSVGIKPGVSNNGNEKRPYVLKNVYDGALETAGTIFETKIDISHPLCYGYKQDFLPVFKVNNIAFEDTKNPYDTPLMFTSNPLIAGYVHPKNYERFKNTPTAVAQRSGAGKVISFSDNPNFRAFWYGTNKLFLNALFFGKGI
jgi:hypothetical protein